MVSSRSVYRIRTATPFSPRPSRHSPLQSPHAHGVGREPEVGFRLSAARGVEEQVSGGLLAHAPVGMVELRHARQVEQDECHLERVPRAILRHIHLAVEVGLLLPPDPLRVDRVRSLKPHSPVHEAERLSSLLVLFDQRQPLAEPAQRRTALGDRKLHCLFAVSQAFGGVVDLRLLPVDPLPVSCD